MGVVSEVVELQSKLSSCLQVISGPQSVRATAPDEEPLSMFMARVNLTANSPSTIAVYLLISSFSALQIPKNSVEEKLP